MTNFLQRLDYLPTWLTISLGLAVGLLLGLLCLNVIVSQVFILIGFLLLLSVAGALVYSSGPLALFAQEPVVDDTDVKTDDEPLASPPKPKLSVEMVAIPDGKFDMEREVTIAAFKCMRTQVTRELYKHIIGHDPGWPKGEADQRPVNQVTWFDAIEFCNYLSDKDGLQRCYQRDENDKDEVIWNKAADGYRLPTEAEWEYACRAGSTSRWSHGDDEKALEDYAWFNKNSDNAPHPVGQKKPNAWGLFDMHGNVDEWCWDWHTDYPKNPQTDPVGSDEGERRVLRGGAFINSAWILGSGVRDRVLPVNVFRNIGFRCVRGPRRQLGH